MLIQRLAIIGVGLIGGSLARALKRENQCNEVIGCGRNITNLQKAIELGVIEHYTTDPAEAVKNADVVVVAVPLGTTGKVFDAIRDSLSEQTIITDVGSAKATVVADARNYLGEHFSYFVPGHPIAGTEKSGVIASFAELFEKHRVILTPLPETDSHAQDVITKMWKYTGAEVVILPVEYHDEVLAATSHLPHVIAYCLVDMLAKMDAHNDIFRFAAGGFRDFTRIASSDPRMWHDICLANREAILKMLARFNTDLAQLSQAIQENDSDTIQEIFKRAKTARDEFYG